MAAGVDESRLEEYREQYQRDPSSLVFALLAEAYRRRGQLDEAEEICGAGLKVHPAYVTAHLVMGDILIDRKRPDEAYKEFNEVLRLDPNNPVAHTSLARIHLSRGDPDRAIEQLELVLFLYPSSINAQQVLEQALRIRDDLAAQGLPTSVGTPAAGQPSPAPSAPGPAVEAPSEVPVSPPPAPPPSASGQAAVAEAVRVLDRAPPPISEAEMLASDELSPEQAIFLTEREQEFLRALGHAEGIREAIIVGREGLVVAASSEGGAMDDVIAASITQIFQTAGEQTVRMGMGQIEEGWVESAQGAMRLVRIGDRVLATVIEPGARLGLVNLHINNAISHIRHLRRRS
jgi:predicted regulator of Ras-like GTPase activity (Roadblock/LC7/MglB family)